MAKTKNGNFKMNNLKFRDNILLIKEVIKEPAVFHQAYLKSS